MSKAEAAPVVLELPHQPLQSQINSEVFIGPDGVAVKSVLTKTHKVKPDEEYKIVSFLGKGAFGRCYEVIKLTKPDSKSYACKILDKINFNSEKIRERVKYEVRVMRLLPKHESVVEFFDLFENTMQLYILMEKCTSKTLHDLLHQRKRLTEFEACYYMSQLAGGITALHSVGIVHRDIKHSNLLLDSGNRIKIADFGLSTIVNTQTDRKLSFLGTPNFLAPELVNREGHSFGVDVWAAGILLFVMLYGRPPFSVQRASNENNIKQLYRRITSEDITFPPHPPVTGAVQSLIRSLCCRDEGSRIRADDICSNSWFSICSVNGLPYDMPQAIFSRPIGNMKEYIMLTGDVEGRDNARSVMLPSNRQTPSSTTVAQKTLFKSTASVHRRPLETISENGNRTTMANLNSKAAPTPVQMAAQSGRNLLASLRSGIQARSVQAPQDKENHPDKLRTTSGHALQESHSLHGYALRSRSEKPNAYNNGNTRPTPLSKTANILPPATAAAAAVSDKSTTSSISSRAQMPAVTNGRLDYSTQVKSDFDRMITTTDSHYMLIHRWKDQLGRFCNRTRLYLRQPMHIREQELDRLPVNFNERYPAVGTYVLSWLTIEKFGLGFRLSDMSEGVLFNDNTSMIYNIETGEYAYIKSRESVTKMGTYVDDTIPANLKKKQNLVHGFARGIDKRFSLRVDHSICSRDRSRDGSKYVLQARSTKVGVIFLLSGNVIQFSLFDHSKLFLYRDAHIFYKDARGHKWHFDLDKGPAVLINDQRIDVEQFLLCLEFAQKVLVAWGPAS
ncbi:Cell cycle serine/threonine-protein kinase cdc5/MSD2 [Coemansia sp. RSA 2703]|nr:Cell cycle serine/threonine-protein kinase cdc5/MSD2 [Coemansia sp. RSA 2703]KAJ2373664.1 Cell cycle serine/threonine-protein kinase cdc5/MSD2 [Coemansia sp. RSA 2607]KAJ2396774.1 Cell cycle serine/threonine-protein kinase cdc5/MSD2 [Coemansia sp. RSA 2603]